MGKVLIIDDDQNYAGLLVHQLKSAGHESSWAPTLEKGKIAAENFQPDLIFLDVNLPDGDGLAAVAHFQTVGSVPEIIIITGNSSPDGAELAVRSGAWDYVQKQGSPSEIMLRLKHALNYREQKVASGPRALDLGGLIGKSPAMRACFDSIAKSSCICANVLITGESGTGKEMCAVAIHQNSRRRGKNFVVVDCAALPGNLVESMLFGHRKGAFTGAVENRAGLIEQADGGTLFLDEVAEMPLSVQKAFLRIIQEKRFRPIGADREVESDFRLIAATNKDLDAMVRDGLFRQDLLFRLRALCVHLPPLRDRQDDTREIATDVVGRICEREKIGTKGISEEFFRNLAHYLWPGNVRELLHAMEYAVASAGTYHTLYPAHLPTEIRVQAARTLVGQRDTAGPHQIRTLQEYREEATRHFLMDMLDAAAGDVAKATVLSGLSRSRFYALLKEHGITN